MTKFLLTTVLMTSLLMPAFTYANTVLRTGDGITIEPDQVVDGDYYVSVLPFGSTVMSGEVRGDMYATGGVVTVNGTIDGDLGIIGGESQMHASVTDDVRIISGETTITEHIGGDLFVMGGTLKVLPTAVVDGDIFFYGATAEINGTVGGSIYGTSDSVRIDAVVGGNIDVHTTHDVTLGARANIAGDMHYTSGSELKRAQNASVEGTVTKGVVVAKTPQDSYRELLTPFLLSLFATLTFYLLFRRQLIGLVQIVERSFLKSSLIGFSALLLSPIFSLLLMVTVLGFFVGLVGIAFTAILYISGIALASVVLGAMLAKLITKKSHVTLLWVFIGAVALNLTIFVPIVGPLVCLALVSVTVGGVLIGVHRTLS